jgi:hypothetical protein
MKYGDRWRLRRKITHQGVGVQAVRFYEKLQGLESRRVVADLLAEPEVIRPLPSFLPKRADGRLRQQYVLHFERYAASVVSIIGFGRRILFTRIL